MLEVRLQSRDHYARGLEHGQALKKEIREMKALYDRFLRELPDVLDVSPFQKWYLKTALGQRTLGKKLFNLTKKFAIPSVYTEEIRGIAEGADVSVEFITVLNLFDDIFSILVRNAGPVGAKCSGAAVKTPYGWLVGCNSDYGIFLSELGKLTTLFYHPDCVVLGYPGFIGALMGMNHHGVVIQQLVVPVNNGRFEGIPASLLFRLTLENARSAEEAVNMFLSCPKVVGNNALIAASHQEAAVLEISPTASYRTRDNSGNPEEWATVTNHFTNPNMRLFYRISVPSKFSFAIQEENFYTKKFSEIRLARLRELLKTFHPETAEDLQKVMADEVLTGRLNGHCSTVACLIFNPSRLEFWFADNKGRVPAAEGALQHRRIFLSSVL